MNEARLIRARLGASLLIGLICVSATCAEEMKPPLLQIGQIDAVQIDGRIGEEEWCGAIAPGFMIGPDASPVDLRGSVRIAWDDGGIAVVWELPGEPTYQRRDRDAAVWRDDAVEIRLQVDDDAPVHRFAVNAGGSMYDARDGDARWNAAWRALALRGTDAWRVEMHIPFAAFDGRPGSTIRANLIVHEAGADLPAAAWAWHGEGEPDGFGYLRLAAAPSPVIVEQVTMEGGRATITPRFSAPAVLRATLFEGETEVQTSEATEAAPLEVTLPNPGDFRLRLAGIASDGELVLQRELPLVRIPPLVLDVRKRLLSAREVDVTIDGSGLETAPDRYVLEAPGVESVEITPGVAREGRATLDLAHCEPGEIAVTATAFGHGEQLASESLTFELPPRPGWVGSDRGRHGRLLEPWTPVQVLDNRVRLQNTVYDFRGRLLPASIRSGGKELLAQPMTLRVRVGDALREWSEPTVRWLETTSTHSTASIIADSPLAEARLRMTCHYDGLITFDLRINPRGDQSLSEVRLEIPMAAAFATHMQIADGTREGLLAAATGRAAHAQAFAPLVWLTGGQRGLQWLGDSDASWSLEDPSQALQVRPGRGGTTLIVTMLDHELLPRVSFETSFALQATPVGGTPEHSGELQAVALHELPADDAARREVVAALAERRVNTVVLDDAAYFPRPGGLGESADAALAEFARLCHDSGLRLMLVIDDDLTRDPIWDAFRDEVTATPSGEGETPRPCPGSAWGDYVVEAAAYAMEHYDADGIHLRGGAGLFGCAATQDQESAGVLGARQLMMRLRTVVREGKPDALLTVEFPEGTPAPAVGFADGLVVSGVIDEGRTISADELVARGGASSLAAVEVALPDVAASAELGRALGLALLHGAALRPVASSAGFEAAETVRRAQTQLDAASANWRPWWSDDAPVTASSPEVPVSTWWRDREVLAVVANLGDDDPVVELVLDNRRLRVGPRLHAVDLLTGERVPQVGDVLRMRMEAGQTSLVHVSTRNDRESGSDE